MSVRALPSEAPAQPVPTAVQAVADYFYQIWRRRYFWWSLVKIDLRTRYRGTYLGLGWSLLNPILMTMVMCLVFAKLFRQPLATYAPFVLSGLAFWNYLTGIVMDGCHSFRRGEAYIRQHPAPLAIYPLKASLVVGIHFLMALVVLLGTVWLARGTVPWHALWLLVPALGLFAVLGWTTALVMGVVNVWFEDTAQLSQVVLRALFYATPVFYDGEMLRKHGLGWVVDWNPLAACLDVLRAPVLHGQPAALSAYGFLAAVALAMIALAALLLWKVERKLIFYL